MSIIVAAEEDFVNETICERKTRGTLCTPGMLIFFSLRIELEISIQVAGVAWRRGRQSNMGSPG